MRLIKMLLCSLVAVMSRPLYAQDLAPRAYVITPMRCNAVTVTWSFCDGGVNFNGTVPITNATGTFSYGPGWYGGGWYGPTAGITTGQTSTIYTGQIDLDMYDAAKHELVWRGVASKTLDPKAKPEKRQKNLNKAVAKLMKNYPPSVKK